MAFDKRTRQMLQKEEERLIRFQEKHPLPKLVVSPFTKEEGDRFERIAEILNRLQHGNKDASLMQELIGLASCVTQSENFLDLRNKFQHFLTLKQQAAKDSLWDKMTMILHKLSDEVNRIKQNRLHADAK